MAFGLSEEGKLLMSGIERFEADLDRVAPIVATKAVSCLLDCAKML
jgi:hypothetical protein